MELEKRVHDLGNKLDTREAYIVQMNNHYEKQIDQMKEQVYAKE